MAMAMSPFKKYLTLFMLSLGGGTIYIVPYYKTNYYDALQAATGLNNMQLGMLVTVYGALAMIFYVPGGIIADKISARILFTFSMITTGLLTLWYATLPSYKILIIIHLLMAVTSVLTFWSAYLKGVRALGTDKEQGKLFGLSDAIRSLAGFAVSFVALALIGNAVTSGAGITQSLSFFGGLYIAIGVICFFLLPKEDKKSINESGEEVATFSLKSIKLIFKLPAVWLISFNIFFWMCAYNTLAYATPYFTQVYGISESSAGTIGIVRMFLVAAIAAPLAGFLSDKMKSASKLLMYLGILSIILSAVYIFAPNTANFGVVMIVVTLLVGGAFAAARGIYFATLAETKIPLYVTGLATGIISIIAYSSDLFMHVMIGGWLDKYGLEGFKITFTWMTACTVGALITSILIRRLVVKMTAKE
ncbi:MFS transporter [Bacillus massiliigorillae]|uniref:MFS transporter n=1 Tax=Bacillus massiliigorillae TaxID=1243664 RepID=UPI00039B01E0|nr:MFS transporter [Bacillus massiliigorillae]